MLRRHGWPDGLSLHLWLGLAGWVHFLGSACHPLPYWSWVETLPFPGCVRSYRQPNTSLSLCFLVFKNGNNTLSLHCLTCFWISIFCQYPRRLLYLISLCLNPYLVHLIGRTDSPHLLCFLLILAWPTSTRTPGCSRTKPRRRLCHISVALGFGEGGG